MARMMPSWVALALLVALLAAAMQHSLAEEEQGAPSEPTTPMAPEATPAADAPAAAEAATDVDDGAPAPSPAASQEEAKEEESPKSIGAKAKAGFHSMIEGLSAGKAKLECKVLGNCPPAAAAAAAPDAPAAA
ncbi:hypothetical protein BS78_09G006300 [Paspalum vaginatum]|nr:hypothetical protein BS78_09G006300 [Paspalum vaginatum]